MPAFSVKGALAVLVGVAALAACGTSPAAHPATTHPAQITRPAAQPSPTPAVTNSTQPPPETPAATTPAAPAPVQTPPPSPEANPIPQNNGGDHDADNNGGPSDGDGTI